MLSREMDRLRENAVVTVSLPSAGRFRVSDFTATVLALIESGAALLPLDVAEDMLPPHADDVFLSFVHGGQLVGLKGALTRVDGRGARFQVQDGVQRRRDRYTRVDAALDVTLARADGSEACHGVTVNVAPEGLLIQAPLTVELGELLTVALALPASADPIELRANVVRHAAGMLAVHFVPDRREVRAALAEFVVERRAAQLLELTI